MSRLLHSLIVVLFCLLLWQGVIVIARLPDYFLPTPWQVIQVFTLQKSVLLLAAKTTLIEALLGFILALLTGCLTAIILYGFRSMYRLFWPILLISQALPTLAIAPLLVLWLGYGLSSKIILVTLMLFFPITSAFLDGFNRINPIWLDNARLMTQRRSAILWRIEIPAALPHLASGIRIAAAGALISAVIGEWVGASQGLGFLLLEVNARFQTAAVFAVIIAIVVLSLGFYGLVSALLKCVIKW